MADAIDEVVHAIQVTQESRLTATRRADESDDLTLRDIEGDGLQGLLLSVPEAVVADADVVLTAFALSRGADLDTGSGGVHGGRHASV